MTPAGYVPFGPPPARPNKGRRILSAAAGAIAVAVIAVVGGMFLNGGRSADAGKVVFSLTDPSTCSVRDQITTATADKGTLHAVGIFHQRIPASQELTLEITWNGQKLPDTTLPHEAVDCMDDQEPLGELPAGTWKFVFKTDKVEAEGSIEIKEP